jgi:hypothetical protein
MNSQTTESKGAITYVIAIVGAFLIVAGLVWAMRHYTQIEPLNAKRAAERAQGLAELRAAEANALHNVGWIDQNKGVVRLRIEDAVEIVKQKWSEDPVAARKDLIARVEKATAVPPAAPAQPSEFE